MSNNQNTNKNNIIEPSFNEYQAYEELRLIFVIAIETQDFSTIEARIAAWERKYPLAEFTDPEIIRKIKAILNKDFLSRLIGDYLAAKILHEEEKQKELYDSLKEIIDTARKNKNYKSAEKAIKKWKSNLYSNGFTLYDFNRLYRAKICTLLLIPSKELKKQDQATDELKKIKADSSKMNSQDYLAAISKWQNTYSIPDFPKDLQEELNQMTTEIFDSISQKRTSENAVKEIESVLSSEDAVLPANTIAAILSKYDYRNFDTETVAYIEKLNEKALSIQENLLHNGVPNVDLSVLNTISPIEAQALTSLTDILNKTPHDMDTILNWIYVNRKINYSEFAREEIVKQFASVGYKIPIQNTYSIPEINPSLDYKDLSKVDDLRKTVILNYLGIISQGNKLTLEAKDNLIEAHAISEQESLADNDIKPTIFVEAFETVPSSEDEKLYNEKGELELNSEEETIYNIFIEDIIDNPLATYSIVTDSTDKSKTSSTTKDTISTVEEPKLVIKTSSTLEDTSATTKNIISDDISEEKVDEKSTSSENSDISYSLTLQDDENLEKAQALSTYIIVATPILEQALAPKKERSAKRLKSIEKIKDF